MYKTRLFSLRPFHALREACFSEPYNKRRFSKDLMAGITVAIVAIPLSMALAIASGVPPQHGLYTAMIAGFIIALLGGSRLSVSGPTAAFVVILYPVTQKFGLDGLLLATFLAGLILIAMALLRLGRLIEYIPESVTLGFTSGIAIVIASLQVKDFFGLSIAQMPESFIAKWTLLLQALPQWDFATTVIASATFAVLVLWSKLKLPIPGQLPAILLGVGLSLFFTHQGYSVETIGSRFSFIFPDGSVGQGIPPFLPHFSWPGLAVHSFAEAWETLRALLPASFSMAMLGAIESLLCAVVLDNMTGKRHSANSELLGQGIGNVVAPFFGGITATAAIARSAVNYRAGAESPIAPMIHSLMILMAILFLAPYLSYLPMASMAALLVMVAWSMSEAHKVVALIKKAPVSDVVVLLTCLSLTVLFDMVVAIGVGVVLAALLFMREVSAMTQVKDISSDRHLIPRALPDNWLAIKINGPLFFAAADRVFSELAEFSKNKRGIILWLDAVPILDAGGLSAFNRFIEECVQQQTKIIVAELQFQPLKTLAKAKITSLTDKLIFVKSLEEGLRQSATIEKFQLF